MIYNEWDSKGELFSYILEPNLFDQTFNSDQIQLIFNSRFSQRDVNSYLAFKSPNEVADMVNVLYLDRWKVLFEHLSATEDLDVGARKSITETVLTNELNSNENTNTEQETTYNSAELSDVAGTSGISTDEKEATVTRTYEEVNTNSRNIDNRLRRRSIVDTITSDVANLLLLSIY